MSTLLGTNHDVVCFKHLRLWAERGLIHIEDARDNSYECISVRTALDRLRAINTMLGNSSQRDMYSEDQFDRATRKEHTDMIEAMIRVIRKAQEQGMPTDPAARRELVRRRPQSVVVPAGAAIM